MNVLLDEEDKHLLVKFAWYINSGYVVRTDKCKKYWLHKTVIHCPDGHIVDHINGNKLDNRKSNLRVCTPRQNMYNKDYSDKKRSKLPKGVTLHGKNYRARITLPEGIYSIGTFKTVEEAEAAYKSYAQKVQAQYALHNSRE